MTRQFTHAIPVRFSHEMMNRLAALADRSGLDKTILIRKAVEEKIPEWERENQISISLREEGPAYGSADYKRAKRSSALSAEDHPDPKKEAELEKIVGVAEELVDEKLRRQAAGGKDANSMGAASREIAESVEEAAGAKKPRPRPHSPKPAK